MNSIAMGCIAFGWIAAGTLAGLYLNRRLPSLHLSGDSKDAIKMVWTMMSTMAALVLSLLLASSKTSFDSANAETAQGGAKIVLLDRVFQQYGPEAAPARAKLREVVSAGIDRAWSRSPDPSSTVTELEHSVGLEAVQDQLNLLAPKTDEQRAFLVQAKQLCNDLLLSRWLIVERSKNLLPNVLFIVLVAWLSILFLGVSLLAPPNKTFLAALFIGNLSFSAALFLISEMNHPLDGLMKVSDASMREALTHISQ